MLFSKKFFFLFAFTLLVTVLGAPAAASSVLMTTPESVGMSSERLRRINAHLSRYIDEGKLSGIVSLVSRHGKVVHFEKFGKRDVEDNKPMERDTLVRIYSMTKPIIATALMMLHEEGKFQLNEPLSKYIPEFKNLKVWENGQEVEAARRLTIQHLLTHTGGFTYGIFGNTEIDKRYKKAGVLREKNLKEMIDHLSEIPLMNHPGDKWHYSVSVDIQGYLVEVLSGRPLNQFLRERIFKPLGMNDTFFQVPTDKAERFAANYRFNRSEGRMNLTDAPGQSKYVRPVTFFSGGGGLVSTAEDYWRFSQMLLNGGKLDDIRVLGRKTVELMSTDHLPAALAEPDPNSTFGFGLGFQVIKDVPSTGAPGSVGDYSWGGAAGTIFWIDPEEDLIAVVMIQLMSSPYNLRREMKSLIYQALID